MSLRMNLIRTGLGLGKTIKHATRLKDIITVLSRNGFDELIFRTRLYEKIPNFVPPKSRKRLDTFFEEGGHETLADTIGYRLRTSFEELGPSFVKLGQLLSTREDIFPPAFIAEMKKLQNHVKGIPFEEAANVFERSLGKKFSEVFASIDSEPIGTASIGVVYKAKLKSGGDVVVKIRRPHIAKTIATDFSLLQQILVQIEKVSDELRYLSLSRIVADFAHHIKTELDYRIEASNCDRLRGIIEKEDVKKLFCLPHVHRDLSTDEVLVLDFIDGIAFNDSEKINPHQQELQEKLNYGIHIFVRCLLIHGFFHADLHGGNFFLMKDGHIGLIDFGSVGALSRRGRENLVAILSSLINFNFENLVYEFLDVAEFETVPDADILINDVKDTLTPYMGLTVQQTNIGDLFRATSTTLAKHRVYLPREWFVIFRALVTLDGVGKSLGMDFDIYGLMAKDIDNILADVVSAEQLKFEALWMGRDVLHSFRSLPRHLRWFLKKMAKQNYALELRHTGHEDSLNALTRAVTLIGFAVIGFGFLKIGLWFGDKNFSSLQEVPKASSAFVLGALCIWFFGVWKSRTSRK